MQVWESFLVCTIRNFNVFAHGVEQIALTGSNNATAPYSSRATQATRAGRLALGLTLIKSTT